MENSQSEDHKDDELIDYLKYKQQENILKLRSSLSQGLSDALIIINKTDLAELEEIDHFTWDMTEKYKKGGNVKSNFFNNFIGKLGEQAVKKYLGDVITPVDYEKYVGGDGGVDFTSFNGSKIQVKTRSLQGNFEHVRWTVTEKELVKNDLIVCVLFLKHELLPSEYQLIIAGFTFAKYNRTSFTIHDLLPHDAMKYFLCKQRNVGQTDLDLIWEKVLNAVTTSSGKFFRSYCSLLSFDGARATIFIPPKDKSSLVGFFLEISMAFHRVYKKIIDVYFVYKENVI